MPKSPRRTAPRGTISTCVAPPRTRRTPAAALFHAAAFLSAARKSRRDVARASHFATPLSHETADAIVARRGVIIMPPEMRLMYYYLAGAPSLHEMVIITSIIYFRRRMIINLFVLGGLFPLTRFYHNDFSPASCWTHEQKRHALIILPMDTAKICY